MEKDCIFCKISQGNIKTEKILENDNFFVIKDIKPKVKGHSLIIPKEHYENFLEFPENLYEELLKTIKETIKKLLKETKAEDFNLILNDGKNAGQIVNHLHIHILPRKKDDGYLKEI